GPNAGLIGEYIGVTNSRLRATMVFTDTRNGHQDVYTANMPLRLFPPKLISPDSGSQSPLPMVPLVWDDWSDYDSALTYILEYTTDPTFATGVVRYEGLTGHSYPGDVLSPDLYYWRVRAVDPFGDSSALSAVRSLEIILICECDCHGDPAECDGFLDVFDVVRAVDVSFREGVPIPDPNPLCPYVTTDATCDDETNVFDVVAIVAVAFRNEDPATVICDPCP
ncbi:MAG: hypothetical protein IIA44_14495, partial [Acidobacteria bacterium]|nr:hypothetical protein [Acidobacteriota bacterium]